MPGSGGQWINYLLWCLDRGRVLLGAFEHFEFPSMQQRDPDYVPMVEFLEHTDSLDQADIVLGSDRAWMNFYVNLLTKKQLINDWQVSAQYVATLQKRNIEFNLDWCDIWEQPEKFLQDLGALIGKSLPYNRVARQAIAQYSRTCTWLDPSQLQNNQHLLLARHLRMAPSELRRSCFRPEHLADPTQSGNYCPLIFNSVYIEKVNQDQVKLSACCINHTSAATDQVDFVNNSHLQRQRDTARRGLPVSGCMHCYHSTVNLQDHAIVTWSGSPVHHQTPRIQKLDYNVDPICNARCIQCSSYYSSAWLAEDQQYDPTITQRQFGQTRRSRPWRELDLDHVEHLYINGGEPLLTNEPQEILEHLAQRRSLANLQLAFNTNGSMRPSKELVELWKQCRGVVVNFSIDSTGSEFDYIRYPLNWEEVVSNIEFYAQLPVNLNLHVAYTLGIHNIDSVDHTMAWVKDMNSKLPKPLQFSTHLCSGPLDLTNAEPELKQLWLSRYQGTESWHQLVRPALVGTPTPQDRTWQQQLEMIDQRRNLSWKTSLPRLYQAWKLSQGTV